MKRLTLISIVLTLLMFILEINYSPSILLHLTTEVAYLILAWYMISVLQFAGESTTVQTPFSILLGIGIISFVSAILSVDPQSMALNVLDVVISIYVLTTTLKIKNARFSTSFKVYGVIIVAVIALKLSIIFLPANARSFNERATYLKYNTLVAIFPFFAILNIVKRTGKVLQDNIIPTLAN